MLRIALPTALATMLLATTALAQYEESAAELPAEALVSSKGPLHGPDVHVVERGDTLWDLSNSYMYDPLLWPSLWALNPHITNPHWIFPGDTVFLSEGRVMKGSSGTFRWSDSRYASTPKPTNIAVRRVGFIAPEEYSDSGTFNFSRESKELLGTYDEVYLDFEESQNPQVGDVYTIYRRTRELEHPVSGDDVGHLVKFIGYVKILDTSAKLKKGVILQAHEEIERGDRVTTWFEHGGIQGPTTNQVELDAVVIDSYKNVALYAQYMYVFIDAGANQGVRAGNRFLLRERGDPYLELDDELDRDKEDFPWEFGGEAMVVEVWDEHCLAIITESLHAFEEGHPVHLYEGY